MTWTDPSTVTTGELITASQLNTEFLGNISYLYGPRYRKTTSQQVVNTVTTTDLLNGEITIPAGAMETDRVVRLTAYGDHVNNTAATRGTPRLALVLGGSVLIDTGSVASLWVASATRSSWRICAEIANLGATGAQWVTFDYTGAAFFNSTATTFSTGEGQWAGPGGGSWIRATGANSGSVDTTAAQALVLDVTLPVASSNLDMTLKGALVEII